VTGCRDVIRDGYNGFLCEAKNVQSLIKAMEKVILLDMETYKKMCEQASERVIHEFDKKIVLQKYLDFIKEVEEIHS
jgi:glycosyltransferase involved in cell wall biosynthesis